MRRFAFPTLAVVAAWLAASRASAREFRPSMFPNGTVIGCAACHVNPNGGGTLNPFGQDVFAIVGGPSNRPFWSPTLAAKDSDGDGFTNGQEVGDPDGDGVATPGAIVTNPGVRSSFPANQAPSVTLTAPANGAQIPVPGLVTLTAEATDPDGSVVQVEFFNGATSLGVDTSSPFSLTVDLGLGQHTLTARATDNRGATKTSTPVQVEIVPATAPTLVQPTLGPGTLHLAWSGGAGPFLVQAKSDLDSPWTDAGPIVTTTETTIARTAAMALFRVADLAEIGATPLTVQLSGSAERPDPVTTTATGTGTLQLSGNTLMLNLQYNGLSAAAIAAHIHGPATAEQTADVLINLAPLNGGSFGTSGTLAGTLIITDAQKASLLSGLTYINIHTSNHPQGEIRGQIVR